MYIYIYIYIYIHIYIFKQMLIAMYYFKYIHKEHIILLKSQIFLFFSDA